MKRLSVIFCIASSMALFCFSVPLQAGDRACSQLSQTLDAFRQPLTRAERDLLKRSDHPPKVSVEWGLARDAQVVGAELGLPQQAQRSLQDAVQFMLGKLVLLNNPNNGLSSTSFIAGKVIQVSGQQRGKEFIFQITIRRASVIDASGNPEEITIAIGNGSRVYFRESPDDKFLRSSLSSEEESHLGDIPFMNLDERETDLGGIGISMIPKVPDLSPIQAKALENFQDQMLRSGWRKGLPLMAYLSLEDGREYLSGKLVAQATVSHLSNLGGQDLGSKLAITAGKALEVSGIFNSSGDPVYTLVTLRPDKSVHTLVVYEPEKLFVFDRTSFPDEVLDRKEASLSKALNLREFEACPIESCEQRVRELRTEVLSSFGSMLSKQGESPNRLKVNSMGDLVPGKLVVGINIVVQDRTQGGILQEVVAGRIIKVTYDHFNNAHSVHVLTPFGVESFFLSSLNSSLAFTTAFLINSP